MSGYSVLIVAGSKSDAPIVGEAQKTLEWFGVKSRFVVMSAHRHPDRARLLAKNARRSGTKVIIAGAGMAAHLAGVLASYTTIPVVGIPLAAEPFRALDSLLSTVQMPSGVPVAAVSVGRVGAVNAAVLAVEILSVSDNELALRLEKYRKEFSPKKGQRRWERE